MSKLGIARKKREKKSFFYLVNIPILQNWCRLENSNNTEDASTAVVEHDNSPTKVISSVELKSSSYHHDNVVTANRDYNNASPSFPCTFNANSCIRVAFSNHDSVIIPPICIECKFNNTKKNLTRFDCRVRKKHTALPWAPVFLAIKIDKSHIDKDGRLTWKQKDEGAIVGFVCDALKQAQGGEFQTKSYAFDQSKEIPSGMTPIIPLPPRSLGATCSTQGVSAEIHRDCLALNQHHEKIELLGNPKIASDNPMPSPLKSNNDKETTNKIDNSDSNPSIVDSSTKASVEEEADILYSSCCIECRKNHFTKKYCRVVLRHRHLPYNTSFHKVFLDQTLPETTSVANGRSRTNNGSHAIINANKNKLIEKEAPQQSTDPSSILMCTEIKANKPTHIAKGLPSQPKVINNNVTEQGKNRGESFFKNSNESEPHSNLNKTITPLSSTVGIKSSFFDGKIPESRMFLAKISAKEVLYEVRRKNL